MGALTTSKIKDTYPGLIKTTDNAAINATPKSLEDGLGNTLPVQVGTGGMIYSGTQDFSGATVTGIPDEDTTYTLSAAQSGSDVNVNLTGSDSTVDTVKLVAGSNVTLTQSGDNITIAAAGGGGADAPIGYSMISNPAMKTVANMYRTPWLQSGYGVSSTHQFAINQLTLLPITLTPGQTIREVAIDVTTASAGGTLVLGLYDSAIDATNGNVYANNLITTFGSVTSDTIALKTITSLNVTLPATQNSLYWIAIKCLSTAAVTVRALDFNGQASGTLPFSQMGVGTVVRPGHYIVSETGASLSSSVATYYTNGNWIMGAPRFPMFGLR